MFNSQKFLNYVLQKNPHEPEFHQAVKEFILKIEGFLQKNPEYTDFSLLERLVEPERIISFKVSWEDDKGNIRVNKGYRVQFNSALGPYKGGLRFHPSVNLSILKFLGFEQVFKNALTGLPMGGGKGGSDFDPKNKSIKEIQRFTNAFMLELFRHIGPNTDVPAGDIGVGSREIGFLFGSYKKIRNEFTGVLTGKGLNWGGSYIRPEATGYGLIYFLQQMLQAHHLDLQNKTILVSGSGNVAQYAVEKAISFNAKVLTMSDSNGYIYVKRGINTELLEYIKYLKNTLRGRLKEVPNKFKDVKYIANKKPWGESADIALPCATQNEIDLSDAKLLVKGGILALAEGANMPTSISAIDYFQKNNVLFAPGKASNAGGVAVSGLEMSQNSLRLQWSKEEVEEKLKNIMSSIHKIAYEYGKSGKKVDYVKGANIAGFIKVANAMLQQGFF